MNYLIPLLTQENILAATFIFSILFTWFLNRLLQIITENKITKKNSSYFCIFFAMCLLGAFGIQVLRTGSGFSVFSALNVEVLLLFLMIHYVLNFIFSFLKNLIEDKMRKLQPQKKKHKRRSLIVFLWRKVNYIDSFFDKFDFAFDIFPILTMLLIEMSTSASLVMMLILTFIMIYLRDIIFIDFNKMSTLISKLQNGSN